MEKTVVFLDAGFLSKLNKYFGEGKYIKYDIIRFSKNISKKQNLYCEHIFYYNAPPFQETPPTQEQRRMKEGYDKFKEKLSQYKGVSIREGRCQRLRNENGNFEYNQKGVDTLLTIDLSNLKDEFPEVKKVILISSDTDFCPAIENIINKGIEVILYTCFDRVRNSPFSRANQLIDCCSNHFQLNKQDFEKAKL